MEWNDEVCTKNEGNQFAHMMGRGMKMYPRLLSPVLASARSETLPRANRDEFSRLFIECVEDTLTDMLGARVREGLLDYMARESRVSRAELIEHPSELSNLLKRALDRGGVEIEKCIMRRLYAMLKWNYKESSDFNFANHVEEARANWKTTSFTDHLS